MTTPLKAGCQTFTWEMLGSGWTGDADDLLAAIGSAGYSGIEITDKMIGPYKGHPARFAAALERHGLTLVSYACGSESGFTEPDALDADVAMATDAIDFARSFPGAHVSFGSATIMSEGSRSGKLDVAARFYNEAAQRGARANVPVAVHPSSHHGTLLLRAYRDRIRYLHLKDVDTHGEWRTLGDGACDVAAVIAVVADAPNFNGWLVVEEESEQAKRDPAAAVALNRRTLATFGI